MKMNTWVIVVAFMGFASLRCWGDAPFSLSNVQEIAQKLSQSPYQDTTPPLPKEIDNVDYDAMRDIRWKEEFTFGKTRTFRSRRSSRSAAVIFGIRSLSIR